MGSAQRRVLCSHASTFSIAFCVRTNKTLARAGVSRFRVLQCDRTCVTRACTGTTYPAYRPGCHLVSRTPIITRPHLRGLYTRCRRFHACRNWRERPYWFSPTSKTYRGPSGQGRSPRRSASNPSSSPTATGASSGAARLPGKGLRRGSIGWSAISEPEYS